MRYSALTNVAIEEGLIQPAVSSETLEGDDVDIDSLLRLLTVSEAEFLRRVADRLALPFVDLSTMSIDDSVVQSVGTSVLFRHQAVPVACSADSVTVAVYDPFVEELRNEIGRTTGRDVELVLAEATQIRGLLKERLGLAGGTLEGMLGDDASQVGSDAADDDENLANESSVVRLVNEFLGDAVLSGASDVHLEPSQSGLGVRYRIDGMMLDQIVSREITRFQAAIVSRIKIMAALNIAEKRLPQDGRFRFSAGREDVDVRVSTIPMIHGESVVLRLLRRGRSVWGIRQLELSPPLSDKLRKLIAKTHGILLVTGPTGSGKTTTLYHLLAEIRGCRPDAKIITIEDPVEYSLPGIHQIQVNEATGLTFSCGLRSVLRHDPDVILLGEIRDQTTARHAIEAALTGHLVLASLHTNDSAGAFTRLMEMGIEPYLVASTLVAAAAQRLVRRLCPQCRVPAEGVTTVSFEAGGCRECRMKGFSGRVPVLELLESSSEIQDLCMQREPASRLRDQAIRAGMIPLYESGLQKVRAGVTTLSEVARITGS